MLPLGKVFLNSPLRKARDTEGNREIVTMPGDNTHFREKVKLGSNS